MNEVSIIPKAQAEVAQTISNAIGQLGQLRIAVAKKECDPFTFAFAQASTMQIVKEALTPEYMAPFMQLAGKKLGFRTDGVYKEEIVKDCLIEAIIHGFKPTGNEFNIISGNMYPTREGFTARVRELGVWHRLTPSIIGQREMGKHIIADLEYTVEWDWNGERHKEIVRFPVKINDGMGVDAILGKGDRRAYKWLYRELTQVDLAEADVTDATFTIVESTTNKPTPVTVVQVSEEAISGAAPSVNDLKIKEKQEMSDNFFDKAKSKEDLEKRLVNTRNKFPEVNLDFYNKKLESFNA